MYLWHEARGWARTVTRQRSPTKSSQNNSTTWERPCAFGEQKIRFFSLQPRHKPEKLPYDHIRYIYTHHKNCFQQKNPSSEHRRTPIDTSFTPSIPYIEHKRKWFLMSQLRARAPETAWTLRWLTFVGTCVLGRCGFSDCFVSDCLGRMTEGSVHGASVFHEIDCFDSVYGRVECPTC